MEGRVLRAYRSIGSRVVQVVDARRMQAAIGADTDRELKEAIDWMIVNWTAPSELEGTESLHPAELVFEGSPPSRMEWVGDQHDHIFFYLIDAAELPLQKPEGRGPFVAEARGEGVGRLKGVCDALAAGRWDAASRKRLVARFKLPEPHRVDDGLKHLAQTAPGRKKAARMAKLCANAEAKGMKILLCATFNG
jgi:hypothetical protein